MVAHTKQTRDVSVTDNSARHSGASEEGERQCYPPGGGETSREISGGGGAPLLSEHVTNIVVDWTAALNEQQSFSICSASLTFTHSHA